MTTVIGYTAARMKQIEDSSIVDGDIVGDELILKRHDGSTVNAGNVRGPQGIQGPGGADLTAVMQLLCPTGTVAAYAGSTAPTGWQLCDGSSLLRTSYAALFAAIGTTYGNVDGTHFNVPDLRQRMPLGKAASGAGSTLGGVGGSKDAIVVSHSHSHSHGININAAGDHSHTVTAEIYYGASTEGLIIKDSWSSGHQGSPTTSSSTSTSTAGNHSHGASSNADATATGSSGTDANLPPFVAMNYIIRY